jgi:surface antigen
MTHMYRTGGVLVLVAALAGCAGQGPNETGGTIVGGVLGGAIGNQVGGGSGRTVATVLGTLIGASIGANIGRHMDGNDLRRTAQVLETVPVGQSTQWVNPDTRNQYTVTPTRTYDSAGAPCREYTVQAYVGGRPDTVYGTACRQSDGSWRVVQ